MPPLFAASVACAHSCCPRAAPKALVPALKKMPTKRGVHLHNLTADSLAFTLDFDNLPGRVGSSLQGGSAAWEPF
jgi:hypothetical protein